MSFQLVFFLYNKVLGLVTLLTRLALGFVLAFVIFIYIAPYLPGMTNSSINGGYGGVGFNNNNNNNNGGGGLISGIGRSTKMVWMQLTNSNSWSRHAVHFSKEFFYVIYTVVKDYMIIPE